VAATWIAELRDIDLWKPGRTLACGQDIEALYYGLLADAGTERGDLILTPAISAHFAPCASQLPFDFVNIPRLSDQLQSEK
jgi:hypothetical protein